MLPKENAIKKSMRLHWMDQQIIIHQIKKHPSSYVQLDYTKKEDHEKIVYPKLKKLKQKHQHHGYHHLKAV